MFVYTATTEEAAVITRVFGAEVEEVTFYDFDYPEDAPGWWEEITATGGVLESVSPGDSGYDELEEIASERDQTVKFGLRIAPWA